MTTEHKEINSLPANLPDWIASNSAEIRASPSHEPESHEPGEHEQMAIKFAKQIAKDAFGAEWIGSLDGWAINTKQLFKLIANTGRVVDLEEALAARVEKAPHPEPPIADGQVTHQSPQPFIAERDRDAETSEADQEYASKLSELMRPLVAAIVEDVVKEQLKKQWSPTPSHP